MKQPTIFLIGILSISILLGATVYLKGPSGIERKISGQQIIQTNGETLTEKEKELLIYQYQEEMGARDTYNYFASLYKENTFSNIAASEQKHMDAIKSLLVAYSLPIPENLGNLQGTFDSLKRDGEKSLQGALEGGIKIEMLDIKDIQGALSQTKNASILAVLENIGGASYNHLRGFSKALERAGISSSIDTTEYLSKDEINSKGPLNKKITP